MATFNAATHQARTRYQYDRGFLDGDVTDAVAWLLGFILTDGCVAKTLHRVTLTQALAGVSVLYYVRRLLGPGSPPVRELRSRDGTGRLVPRGVFQLELNSRQLAEACIRFGILPAKSRIHLNSTRVAPNVARLPGYWRGHLEGDGTLGFLPDGTPYVFFLGGEASMRQCADVLSHVVDAGGPVTPFARRKKGRQTLWYVRLTGYRALQVVRWMYVGAPRAHGPKFALAQRVLRWSNSRSRARDTAVTRRCAHCGARLTRTASRARPSRWFCNQAHRTAWRRAHRRPTVDSAGARQRRARRRWRGTRRSLSESGLHQRAADYLRRCGWEVVRTPDDLHSRHRIVEVVDPSGASWLVLLTSNWRKSDTAKWRRLASLSGLPLAVLHVSPDARMRPYLNTAQGHHESRVPGLGA